MTKRLVSTLLFIVLSLGGSAQSMGDLQITNASIRESKSEVMVCFDAMVTKLGSNYKLTFTPILYSGANSMVLTSVEVSGRNREIAQSRTHIKVSKAIQGTVKTDISYSITVPYECWMNDVSLRIDRTIEHCYGDKILTSLHPISDKLIHYDLVPLFDRPPAEPVLSALQKFDKTAPFLYPTQEYVNRYQIFEKQREKGALKIYFKQGYWSIDPSYKCNYHTLAEVNNVLDMIKSDSNATLKKIVIVGLTSPEGILAKNDILAQKRANSMKYFVGARIRYNPTLFETINGSEDWDGLKQLVEESAMPNRWLILDIIDNVPILGGREKQLMDVDGGEPYRYMMEHFFPLLRNSGYIQIYYDYAVKPDINVDNISNALVLMQQRKYEEALSLLFAVKDQKRTLNLVGVCYMMSGDFVQAEKYLNHAITELDTDAVENLRRLKIAQSIK